MSRINLMQHQVDVLSTTEDHNRVGYFLDMGLGKTFVGAEKMHRLNNKVNLLVCQKSKVNDWLDHFETYYDYEVHDLTKNLDEFFESDKQRVGVINYDILYRRKKLKELSNFTLMLDESSMIKNEKAKRSKAVLQMNADNVILLSGTPTGGKYEELWSQCKLLGWDVEKEMFYNLYTKYKWVDYGAGFKQRLIYGYKNVDRLKRKLGEHGAVFMKTEEVLTLPLQTFNKVSVEKNASYDKFMKYDYVVVDGKELAGDTMLARLLYARQLCGQYSKEKLQAFKDLIESSNDRFIVFYNFTEELNRMLQLLDGRPYSIVNGQSNDLGAYEKFENSITFVQYQAGAMGLNLQKANRIIYFTLPLSSELYEQSKKRIHRVGQERPCFYYILLVKGSVEEKIQSTLDKRQDYTEELFRK